MNLSQLAARMGLPVGTAGQVVVDEATKRIAATRNRPVADEIPAELRAAFGLRRRPVRTGTELDQINAALGIRGDRR